MGFFFLSFEAQKGETCVLCEYVVQTLDTMLENKTDKDAVKQALVTFGEKLNPRNYSTPTSIIVSNPTSIIVYLLVK